MSDLLTHNGYSGSVRYSDEDKVFHGKIEFIRALVTYEGTNIEELTAAFEEAVSDYLDLCVQQNQEPERPFKGSFNVRPGTHLHRQAVLYAREHDMNLNTVVIKALEKMLGT